MCPPLSELPAFRPFVAFEGRAIEAGVIAVLAGLGLAAGWTLVRRLQRRTEQLNRSEERWRTVFEHAGVVMFEEDFSEMTRQFAALRAAGVSDLRAHLAAHPAEAVALFRLLRVTAANRATFALLGGGDLPGMNAAIRAFVPTAPSEAFAEKAVMLWERRTSLTLQTGITGLDGVRHFGLMQCAVPTVKGRPDFARVLVVFTDFSALRESEERFRELFESAIEGVYEASPEGGFRRVNPAFARLLGHADVGNVLALTPAQVAQLYVAPGRRDEFFAALGAGDRVMDFESEVRRADGTTVWIKENIRAVRGPDGGLQRLQGFVSDITARKEAEAALRASETRYRLLFENSPVGIVELNSLETLAALDRLRTAGVTDLAAWMAAEPAAAQAMIFHLPITAMNAAALRLVGAQTIAEAGGALPRIFGPEAIALRRHTLLEYWAGRDEVEGETPITSLDGVVRRVYVRWWMPQIAGRPLGERTQLALVDITAGRAAETALAAERARLAVTLRAMTESVITIDPAGVVQFLNEAAGRLTGWEPAAAVGRPIDEVCRLTDEKKSRPIFAPVASALAAARPIDLPPHTLLLPPAGAPRAVEGRCAPMHDPAGRGLGAVLVLRDVTERNRFETEMIRASKLESVGLLAGGIAHDFNNLLSVILGNLTLALLDEKTAAAGGRWLKEAERGTARAKELTQQLLTFARGGEPVRNAVPLGELVREAAEFALHGTNARCAFDLAADVRPADADKGQIGQVVQNLVINAAQAMPEGGTIRLSLRNEAPAAAVSPPLAAGDYVRLEIADTGCGIAPENLPRVFEPFFTTKEHGTGLGLATVYSIVQKHQGHITVDSEPGRGTAFRIWLPAARTAPLPPPVSASPFEPLRGRVLFMDDEEPIREMTRSLLERLGLEVTLAPDGEDAVRQFAAARAGGRPFDVVIVDLTVPGGKGGATAMTEILRLDPAARGIVSSGYSSDPIMADFRAHGFRGSVPKPYKVADFARTLRAVLKEK
jgi:PAS domain S-box-containing protein